ncbi:MAG: hypothetical protein O2955_06755 [Planctomycetota bacterium]|nr:hypothetical protein [Planctomycetota bacterium]MDA1212195.1 hypothetical protein [Planctomycetota bacterium]
MMNNTTDIYRRPTFWILGCYGCLLVASFFGDARADDTTNVRDLASRRELFVDDWLIDTMDGVALELHPAVEREIALPLDQPWAGPTTGFTCILKDGDLYRLYYSNDTDGSGVDYTSYAESTDGIHWTRPSLGLIEFEGSKDNNIIWAETGIHSFNVFRDDNPVAPAEERYKCLCGGPITLFTSPDAIHWKKVKSGVLADGHNDSQNLAFWDPLRGEYIAYARLFVNGVRHIRTATSVDFLNWSPSESIVFPEGTPMEHLYTNAVTPYFRAPHIYVGLPMRFIESRKPVPGHLYPGVSDGVLITSRDGVHFNRTFLDAFIRPGTDQEDWTDRTNLPTWGIVPTGPTEMSVYWVENFRHPNVRLRRGSLRLDGFASVHASPAGGEFVTKPLTFTGSELHLNFQTSAPGSIHIALLDENGNELPEYSREEAAEIYGNDVDRVVTWQSGSDLSALAGTTIRLKFVMRDAHVYSIQFTSP